MPHCPHYYIVGRKGQPLSYMLLSALLSRSIIIIAPNRRQPPLFYWLNSLPAFNNMRITYFIVDNRPRVFQVRTAFRVCLLSTIIILLYILFERGTILFSFLQHFLSGRRFPHPPDHFLVLNSSKSSLPTCRPYAAVYVEPIFGILNFRTVYLLKNSFFLVDCNT